MTKSKVLSVAFAATMAAGALSVSTPASAWVRSGGLGFHNAGVMRTGWNNNRWGYAGMRSNWGMNNRWGFNNRWGYNRIGFNRIGYNRWGYASRPWGYNRWAYGGWRRGWGYGRWGYGAGLLGGLAVGAASYPYGYGGYGGYGYYGAAYPASTADCGYYGAAYPVTYGAAYPATYGYGGGCNCW